jgi:addiction module HigA family antidote
MAKKVQNEYNPDTVSSPGETLLETLETIGMPQVELARRMDRPVKTINEIIQGKASITAGTAMQLEQVLGVSASFWLRREQRYQEYLARHAEEHQRKKWTRWLKEFPMQEMIRRGWISSSAGKAQQVSESLKFFGVASPEAWCNVWEHKDVEYRTSSPLHSNFGAVTAWLRRGEIEAREIECAPYNAGVFRDALSRIRALTLESIHVVQEELIRLCANAGVAVVFVQEFPDTGIYGATQWLTPSKALIQLSFLHQTDDQFWFTFFHEAGHILRQGKRKIFLETDQRTQAHAELEADRFASNMLIDPVQWRQFIAGDSYRTRAGIVEFAQKLGIAPGIVVGRLQHEKLLPFDYYNELKRRLEWKYV